MGRNVISGTSVHGVVENETMLKRQGAMWVIGFPFLDMATQFMDKDKGKGMGLATKPFMLYTCQGMMHAWQNVYTAGSLRAVDMHCTGRLSILETRTLWVEYNQQYES